MARLLLPGFLVGAVHAQSESRSISRRWLILGRGRLLAVLAALAFLSVVPQYVRAYRIHGPSDAPNYLWDDLILVNRAAYDVRFPFSKATLDSAFSVPREPFAFSL